MLHQISFQEVVASVLGATKEKPATFYHTWHGWVSKGVLHVGSTSGARERDMWHFPLEKNHGARLFFKNTTGTAYVYARPGAQDEFGREVAVLNPYARIERVSAIDAEMYMGGSGCSHDTRGGSWFSVLADGEVEVVARAPRVQSHSNQFHVGCQTGPDTVRVSGGTYAVQVERNKFGLRRVLVTPQADGRMVLRIIRADSALWTGDAGPAIDLEEEGATLPKSMKKMRALEEERRKRF